MSNDLFVHSDSEDSDAEVETMQEQTGADVEAMAGAEQSAAHDPAPKPKKLAIQPTTTAEQQKQIMLSFKDKLVQNGFLKPPTHIPGLVDNTSDTGSEHNQSQDEASEHAAEVIDGEDKGTHPTKRSRHPSKKSSKSTVKKAKNATSKGVSKPKKSHKGRAHSANLTSKGLLYGDLLGDATSAQKHAPLPIHKGGTRRDLALEGMLASLPEGTRNKKQSKTDMKWLNDACRVFGNHQVKPAEDGLWKVSGMKSTLKPHQILGTAFMLTREAGEEEPRGGILADQMGLGKTIMTLALIVSNPAQVRSEVSNFHDRKSIVY